jgi:glycosyltransferase involved in cell wall biosynthesis
VIARPCGAVPEVVVPGRTGFVGESIVDLVDGVKRIESIDRRECRRRVEALFSVERMADGYETLYRRLTRARAA